MHGRNIVYVLERIAIALEEIAQIMRGKEEPQYLSLEELRKQRKDNYESHKE